MQHKNIAILMTALDADSQAETIKGIEQYGKRHGYNIAVFLWFTGSFEKEKHNLGEVHIVDLPDLCLFDGVIVFANALHIESNRVKIEQLLEGLTCPIVSIGCRIKNAYYVGTDNYTAMRELVEHFVVDHQKHKIHFVKGIEGNQDSAERYRAYVDVLEEHGIPVTPERISEGDFYVTGGELAAKEILSSTLSFPEVIVCANDVMAITICDILMKHGYRVPEDVLISGYDYTIEARGHSPRITSVRSRFKEIGEVSCKVLVDVIGGAEVEREIYLADEVMFDESCGCWDSVDFNIVNQKYVCHSEDIARRKMIHQMIKLEKDIMEGNGFEDWIGALKQFISDINPPEFYCCVNEGFVENVFNQAVVEQEDMAIEEKLAYSQKVHSILSYQNGIFKNRLPFESRYAFEDLFKDSEQCKLYIFSPVHYLERTFGYLIFVDSDFPIDNQLYINWLMNMGHSIENIRKQSLLKNAMSRMDEMSIRDSLTGAYNRFGMERHFSDIKRKCLMSSLMMHVSFVDLDNLKKINDWYGHEEGDRVINAAAMILQQEAGKNYVIRYGGDEFIVMGAAREISEVEDYWERVQQRIKQYNERKRKQAQLSMSFGYDLFPIDANSYLEECISVSDKKMYIEKKRKKQMGDLSLTKE